MRAIRNSLAIICLLGLAVMAVSALVERHPERPIASRIVYVDLNRLMVMHPAWQQVLSVRAAMGELSGVEAAAFHDGSDPVICDGIVPVRTGRTTPPSRSGLILRLQKRALLSLARVEDHEREKIERDLEAKRVELEADMRARVSEKIRETDARLASERHAIDLARASGRLEAQLKIAAIKTRIGSANPAEDRKAKEDLASAEAELAAYDRKTSESIDRQCRTPMEDLEHFKARARLQLEADLAQMRTEHEVQVMTGIVRQRDQTLVNFQGDALSGLAVQGRPVGAASDPLTGSGARRTDTAGKTADLSKRSNREVMSKLRETEKRLIARIRRDVARSVQSVAREHRLTVRFGHRPVDEPDFTLEMVRLIREARGPCRLKVGTGGSG